jgi:hypothetical protein
MLECLRDSVDLVALFLEFGAKVGVFVGEHPAFDTGLSGELQDGECSGGVDRLPASSRRIAARIASRSMVWSPILAVMGSLVVVGDDLLEAGEFVSLAGVPDGRGERVVDGVLELSGLAAQEVDVAVGAGDVRAGGATVGDVGGAAGAVVVPGDAIGSLGGVEHASHALAGEDL